MEGYAEKLNKANQGIRFTNIKGKEYAEVNQRILAFWSLFPDGRIVTRKAGDDGKRCDFVCEVYRDREEQSPAATGSAFEVRQGNVNSTSYVENCETSAVGRALGMLGIGATTAIASADEVNWAIEHQHSPQAHAPVDEPAPTEEPKRGRFDRVKELKAECLSLGVKEEGIRTWLDATFGKPMKDFTAADIKATEEHLKALAEGAKELGR